MNPTVTIIMATYNRAHFIVETLQSIQKQTYSNWECLIIDDGGTDNTEEVINPLLEKDPRFQYLQRPNTYKKGLPGCRNYGLDVASGDYIIFFDDDDLVHPQNIELGVLTLDASTEIFFCNYKKKAFEGIFESENIHTIIDYNVKETAALFLDKMITNKTPIASCTVLWKKECFKGIRFNEMLMYAEEWECFQRIFSTKLKGVLIDVVLYFNRKHANSNTGEFYNNNTIRIDSKKEAIRLVTKNLVAKNLLAPSLLKYLTGITLPFRDKQLLNDILKIGKTSYKIKLYLNIKYYLFPIWKIYKRAHKKLN